MHTLLRFVLAALVLTVASSAYALSPVACTMDAKLCPDGVTYVGRDGNNNCAWQPCPGDETRCEERACSPMGLEMPNWQCPDGSIGGPVCTRMDDGSCDWIIPACPQETIVGCSRDAKLCPDGVTYVGRDGNNNCEWQKCPGEVHGCTRELKICPDGTGVGRTGPNCEFEACPIQEDVCALKDCGEPSMGMPNWQCPDGTTGGPVCAKTDDGSCAWIVRDCPNDSTFSDVPTSHPNSDAIFYVRSAGIVQGYADGTFRPDATINRAEFVKILMGSFEDDGRMCKIVAFTDVDQTAWYATYAHKARCQGIVEGYPDGTFKPAASINFVEAAKILSNAYGLLASTTIPSCDSDCPWYRDHVIALEARGAIPTSITSFGHNITRGEMAEMIERLRMGGDKPTKTFDDLQFMEYCDRRIAAGHSSCE